MTTAGGSDGETTGLIGWIRPGLIGLIAWITPGLIGLIAWIRPGFTATGPEFAWIGLVIWIGVTDFNTPLGIGLAGAPGASAAAPIVAIAATRQMLERFNLSLSSKLAVSLTDFVHPSIGRMAAGRGSRRRQKTPCH